MDPVTFAQGTLILFLAIALGTILWQALRWPDGWHVWLLSVINRLYLGAGFQLRVNRPCPFPDDSAAIIIANHSSPLDPMIIWQGRRRIIGFMMAREYYEVRFVHWISVTMQCIPVDRNGKDLGPTREALRRLKNGQLLGVFPEGGINLERKLRAGNPGMAWLALRSQAPVYPVYIQNAPDGKDMVEPFYNFRQVRIFYGDPIDLSAYYSRKASQEVLHEVTDIMMSRIAELGGVDYTPCSHHEPSP